MKKFLSILICNIILIIGILGLCEFLTYKYQAKIFYDTHPKIFPINKYSYEILYPLYLTDLRNYFNGQNNLFYGRLPDGTEYKNKTPIILFGCSYAFGQHLNSNQTLSYKLAHNLKRPVFNRGISGGSFQHMYMQVMDNSFWEDIPKSDTVIYVMISDHYRRTMLRYFDILDHHILPHYLKKGNKLIKNNCNNKLLDFINSLYISKTLNHIYAENFTMNPQNADKLTDLALLYFTETRKELQKHWGEDFKFIILMYEDWNIMYKEELIKKLQDNGFIVICTKDITDEDLRIEKYQMQDNHHPTEAAWDLLLPELIKKIN